MQQTENSNAEGKSPHWKRMLPAATGSLEGAFSHSSNMYSRPSALHVSFLAGSKLPVWSRSGCGPYNKRDISTSAAARNACLLVIAGSMWKLLYNSVAGHRVSGCLSAKETTQSIPRPSRWNRLKIIRYYIHIPETQWKRT